MYYCVFDFNLIQGNHILRLLTYLKCTTNLDLCYKKSDHYKLKGYSHVDFAENKIEGKNTNKGCHFIGPNLISWSSKKQAYKKQNFIRDYVKKILDLKFISIENQLADIFLKDKLAHIKNILVWRSTTTL
ncbi:hypothetical protein CR513_31017, partial [Mucuna pruriens]